MNISHRLSAPTWHRGLALTLLSLGVALAQQTGGRGDTVSKHTVTLADMSSQYNREVLWMSIPAIVMSIIIFIGVSAALFYSVWKFRERKGDTREPSQFHGNNTLEVVLIAVPFVIITVLAVLTARTMARVNTVSAEAERVQVYAAQFWWNFEYPTHGGIRNGNEMVVPAGQPLQLEVTARDVMHGFWAPNLGGQRMNIPGHTSTYSIDTTREGVYQGNCSQLCGASHANMRYKVIALPQDQYSRFVAAAQAFKAPEPAPGSAEERGYQIFANGKEGQPACQNCHRVQGTPFNGAAGPDLSYFGSRYTLGAGMWEGEARQRELPLWLKNSPGVKPGSLMPAYPKLNDRDIGDLVAYLDSLKLPEDAAYYSWETKRFKVPER
ncbi:cytochrome c oxidase subunit 2 [Deinococcus yavapaiensis KR-236]|uniref:Cytochrome c oxidase subunit 2 n=1 Tax=Deinococcus yavapaiensis KR-236 TaxID=694435 RepID=A0A318SK27_9DEIO|nr:cytochrome c oxidase subunit 2 [Deinococcus yavapaiensis KR-236]